MKWAKRPFIPHLRTPLLRIILKRKNVILNVKILPHKVVSTELRQNKISLNKKKTFSRLLRVPHFLINTSLSCELPHLLQA
jgi:hypothetical protein